MNRAMFLAAFLLAGCATTDAMTMKLASEGGIGGHGVGGVTIEGANAAATDGRRSCSGMVGREEASRLRELAAAAHPESWPESYASAERPHGAPDQIRYSLSVGAHATSWYGEAPENVPQDLLRLFAALKAVQQRVMKNCP